MCTYCANFITTAALASLSEAALGVTRCFAPHYMSGQLVEEGILEGHYGPCKAAARRIAGAQEPQESGQGGVALRTQLCVC